MTIKNELIELMERKGMNQTQVARAIGLSPATINQYLQDKYNGDVSSVNHQVQGFLDRTREKEQAQRIEVKFVPTSTSKKALELIRWAHVEGEINVLYGEAGLGKTMVTEAYAAKYPDAILIQTDPNYSARVVLEELCSRLGLPTRGNMHELSESIIHKLRGSGRLVIIDEAELLPYRALEVLRRIHDKTGIGLVLAGMPRLIINLKGKRGEFAQLYSRVAFALNIGNALPKDDIETIAASVLSSTSQELSEALYLESKGNGRRLFKLLRGAVRLSHINDTAVTVSAVRQSAKMLIN